MNDRNDSKILPLGNNMEYIGISLQEYLIKYSNIDRQFIKDFIAIQQSDISREYYPFVVNLEMIMKWLQITQKGHLKETLKKTYLKNFDYILLSPDRKQTRRGGHNKEMILVTIKCFKRICLKTNSIMSDKIIDYYIALENLLIEYQQYIITVLIKENKLLKNDLNNDIFPVGGLIYIIKIKHNYFKVGSTKNLKQRKMIYETGTIHKQKIIFWFETEDMKSVERCVKGLLTKFAIRKRKEVYLIGLDTIIRYIRGCVGMISNAACEVCNEKTINLDHFEKRHKHELSKSYAVIDFKQFGGNETCSEVKILAENPEHTTYLVTDRISEFKYVVKKGKSSNICSEIVALTFLLEVLKPHFDIIRESLPDVYSYYRNSKKEHVLIREYIAGFTGYELEKLPYIDSKDQLIRTNGWLEIMTSENSSPRRRTFSDGSVVDVSPRRYTNGGPCWHYSSTNWRRMKCATRISI